VTFLEILEDIRRRDERDGGRSDAPMVQAPDAVLLDTSQMTIERATDAARRIVEAARARWEISRKQIATAPFPRSPRANLYTAQVRLRLRLQPLTRRRDSVRPSCAARILSLFLKGRHRR